MSSNIGSIVHFSPGRVRLRISRPHRTPETYAEVRRLLGHLPGIAAVEINPTTGSVLIRYDPDTLDVAQLLKLGSELGWVPSHANIGGTNLGVQDWRSQVDKSKLAEGLAVLAVAIIGGMAAPVLGLSARFGSLGAAAAFVLFERRVRRGRSKP